MQVIAYGLMTVVPHAFQYLLAWNWQRQAAENRRVEIRQQGEIERQKQEHRYLFRIILLIAMVFIIVIIIIIFFK